MRELPGVVWSPRNEPALGVVLCPGRVGGAANLDWLAQPLAAAGALVAGVGYRDDGRYLVDDVAQAVERRAELRPYVPADAPVVVIGHSRGGTVALLAAAWHTGWNGVAALSPTTDQERLVRGLEQFAPTRYRQMVATRGAAPDEDPPYYRETSPLTHAGHLRIPVLLVHGTSDLVIPHDHSLWMQAALADLGELVLIDAAGHFFERMYGGYVFDEVVGAVLAWLRGRDLLRTATS